MLYRGRSVFVNILMVLFIMSGVVLLIYSVIPDKRVEVITTKAKYLSTRVDRSHISDKEDKPRYYAEFDLEGVLVEIYMGHARRKIAVDAEGLAVLYRDEKENKWCLTEADARTQSKVVFMFLGTILVFSGGVCYVWR